MTERSLRALLKGRRAADDRATLAALDDELVVDDGFVGGGGYDDVDDGCSYDDDPFVEEPDALEFAEREMAQAELDAAEEQLRAAPKKAKKEPKKRKTRGGGGGGAKSKRMRDLRETHDKEAKKDAEREVEAALDALGDSAIVEVHQEAQTLCAEITELRKAVRRNRSHGGKASAVTARLRALVHRTTPAADSPLAQLVGELAGAANELGALHDELRDNLERAETRMVQLAERAMHNAAQCASTATRVARASASTATALIGAAAPSTAGALAAAGGRDAPGENRLVVASAMSTVVAKVNQAAGRLSLIDAAEHPRFAVRIGEDGRAAIGASVRPAASVVGRGNPSASYVPVSLARQDVRAQHRRVAQVSAQLDAQRRAQRQISRMRSDVAKVASLAFSHH